ncbi:hypothetical protein [Nocardia sp. SSK8]|uniref:hypothetical protein n=1 Tax=Nocardia sp. SSK8 TaxID=3120154 RepID=UPI003009E770
MTGALDPLDADTGRLHAGLNQPASASAAGNIATVRVGADGALEAVHLTEAARRLDPDTLVATIVRLHAAALAESRAAVMAAVARLETDPRLRDRRERYVDALGQAPPSAQSPLTPQPATPHRPQPAAQSGNTAARTQPQPAEHGWNTTGQTQPQPAEPRWNTTGQAQPQPAEHGWNTVGQAQPRPAEHGWNTTPAAARSAPTPEDDDADDEYFQRESWLEYD